MLGGLRCYSTRGSNTEHVPRNTSRTCAREAPDVGTNPCVPSSQALQVRADIHIDVGVSAGERRGWPDLSGTLRSAGRSTPRGVSTRCD